MEIKDVNYGFECIKKKYIADIDSTLYEFKHNKSGATLVYLENDDTNKCFQAGFRTLPEDSTGVCHIIEHTMLCGSDKYPLKEPFVNLLKGSMATFLNAMTATDWTVYPVASQNDKDFDNLMSCYLDAVFAPLSIKDIKPFLQEGWHIEMDSPEDIPSYKGVVYNEMKGAMSGVDDQLFQASLDTFYAGTGYGVNSGGDPEVIPTLTYDYYKDFYKKHYHPENCLLYLYGKMDILEKLKYIDEEYLSKYTANGYATTIDVPKPLINTEFTKEYAIGEDEDIENNTYFNLTFALDKYENMLELTAFKVLDDALFSANDSPLKKALLDAGLGEDIETMVNDDCILPSFNIICKKSNPDKKEAFYTTFLNACKDLVKNGIDKKVLLATINNSEFKNKELDAGRMPKGLIFSLSMMNCFIFNIPLEKSLEYSETYATLKKNLETDYFEKLIEKYFLNSKHYTLVTLLPSKTLAAAKEAAMTKKMTELKAAMSEDAIDACVKMTQDLKAYQSKKDTLEELKTLPQLELSDITLDVNTLVTKEVKHKNYTVLEHEFATNTIGYMKMYFDLKPLTVEELSYLSVLPVLVQELDTEGFKANDLQNYIKTYLGDFNATLYTDALNKDEFISKLQINISALEENISYMPKVLDEILNKTIYDPEKIKTLMLQYKARIRNVIIQNGMSVAINEVAAYHAAAASLVASYTGYSKYTFVNEALEDIDAFAKKLAEVVSKVINTNNLVVSLSGDRKTIDELYAALDAVSFSDTVLPANLQVEAKESCDRAIVIPSEVNYNAKGINLAELGMEYSGKMNVLSQIIRYDYLWTEIRVLGGAYGTAIDISPKTGCVSLGSYRDPNVTNTYATYDKGETYLKEFAPTADEFKTYIIGALGNYDKPESNNSRINSADHRILSGVSDERRMQIKKEMLETTVEDIKNYSKIFTFLKDNATKCTIGNETKIKEYNKFDTIINL